ncbi:hypothetical protein HK104_007655, partial [Borealophlyctis nickersoniae]
MNRLTIPLLLLSTLLALVSAAPPIFPDNLLVFPNRDFVTIEGFQDKIGQTGLLEVTRQGKLIGSAQGVVTEGAVAFEVNHPGGYCWGAGTGVNVTPDIQPGDVVSIKFGGASGGDTVVQDAFVTGFTYDNDRTLVVTGRLGPGIDPANIEQRTVNPDLTATAVGRRDVRAIPGPLTPAPRGGYSSSLTIDQANERFTATYIFDTASVAKIAASGGGHRLLTWQVTDAAGNRQGVTIAEFGESGGPGMGGCPLGPTDAAPPAGSYSAVFAGDGTSAKVTWTPATAQPGAEPVAWYDIQLFENKPYPRRSFGIRTPAGSGSSVDFTGLSGATASAYVIE